MFKAFRNNLVYVPFSDFSCASVKVQLSHPKSKIDSMVAMKNLIFRIILSLKKAERTFVTYSKDRKNMLWFIIFL